MEDVSMNTKVTLKEVYLIMFDYLDKFWERGNKSDDGLGALLGLLSLWNTENGKEPIDGAVFPDWIKSAKIVIEQEQIKEGYRNADISFLK